MSETPQSRADVPGDPGRRLQEVASLLRKSGSLDPEAQRALADLVAELSRVLEKTPVPPTEVAQLANSATHLAEALHYQKDRGILGAARDSLERAVINAEIHAPFAVGIARRLLDALANIGV